MNIDFHYYATYLAAIIAGYSHEESSEIAHSAQFVDCCTRTILTSIKAPLSAATTQSQVELIKLEHITYKTILIEATPSIQFTSSNPMRLYNPYPMLINSGLVVNVTSLKPNFLLLSSISFIRTLA